MNQEIDQPLEPQAQQSPGPQRWWLHAILFILTFFTATVAGVGWVIQDPFELTNLGFGLSYAVALLFVLTCHEFGHYFAARFHHVETSLPYYIPFPPIPLFVLYQPFGTLGAVIRTREVPPSKKAMFDIGVAGPIAGFVASIFVLFIGFSTLPSVREGVSYIQSLQGHESFVYPALSDGAFSFGQNALYWLFEKAIPNSQSTFIPPMSEMYHFPFLCVGWFGLFITAMNLIPIGQFDGGHLIYTMFGDHHRRIARFAFFSLVAISLPAVADFIARSFIYFKDHEQIGQVIPLAQYSWFGWFLWAMIANSVVKLYHPPVPDETPLDGQRMAVGWACIVIFVLCFSLVPFGGGI
jgi:membrane-associated protease RseP (regulator of RpoE activity)